MQEIQSWALSVFFTFSTIKNDFFAIFMKLMWLGVGFLIGTGAEMGYYLDKKYKKLIFY